MAEFDDAAFSAAYDAETHSTNARLSRMSAWLTDNPNPLPEVAEADAVQSADGARAAEADSLLAAPDEDTPAALEGLAQQQGTDTGAHATVGMGQRLAAATNEPAPAPLHSAAAWRERVRGRQHYLNQTLGRLESDLMDQFETGPILGSEKLGFASSALAIGIEGTKAAIGEVFVPDVQYNLIKIAQKYTPNASNQWHDMFDRREVFSQWAQAMRMLPEDQFRKAVGEIVSAFEENSGWFNDNLYTRNRMVRELFSSFSEDVGTVDQVFHGLAFLGPVAGAVDAAALVTKAATTTINAAAATVRATRAAHLADARNAAPTVFQSASATLRAAEEAGNLRNAPLEVFDEAAKNRFQDAFKTATNIKVERTARGWKVTGTSAKGKPITRNYGAADIVPEPIITPTIAVGSTADAAAMTAKGAADALRLASAGRSGDAALAARGTNAADVTGTLLLPKFDDAVDGLDHPVVHPLLWSDEALEATKETVRAGLGDALQLRLKDTIFDGVDEGGIAYRALLGSSKGKPYPSAEYADNLARDQFGAGNYSIVANGSGTGFFIQVQGKALPGLNSIKSQDDWVKAGAWWKKFFGVEAAFTDSFNAVRAAYQRMTDLGRADAQKILAPLYALPRHEKAKVLKLIDDGDRQRVWYTHAQATQMLGTAKEADAYMAYQNFARKSHGLLNTNVRAQLVADGWAAGRVANQSTPMKAVAGNGGVDTFVDAATGKIVHGWNKGDQVYELLTPLNGSNYVISRAGSRMNLASLPRTVVQSVDGYIYRKNTWTHFLVDDTGRTIAGASSEREAARGLADYLKANPGKSASVRQSSELSGLSGTDGVLQNLKQQGLFYHMPQRGTSVLKGVDGTERVTSVDEAIQIMQTQYGHNAGLARWTEVVLKRANQMISGIPGAKLGMGVRVNPSHTLTPAQQQLLDDATRLVERAEVVNGVAHSQLAQVVSTLQTSAARAVLNAGDRTRMVGGKFLLTPIGRAMAGVGSGPLDAARSVTFYTLLGSNVFRNWATQTSMFWHYTALNGGARYLMGGGYVKDASLLMTSLATGKTLPGADKLVKLWDATGLAQSVKGHPVALSLLGQGAGTRSLTASLPKQALGATLNTVRKIGFDAPIYTDKVNAFLFSLKRMQAEKGAKWWPTTTAEIEALTKATEKLTLNANKSGALLTEQGLLGVATQFLGHQLKMTGRIMGLEDGFSRAERLRMGIAQLAMYGASGLGVSEWIDSFEAKTGSKLSPEAKTIIQQGVYGAAFNTAIDAIAGGDSDQWMDLSGSISPVNFFGPNNHTLSTVISAVATGGMSGLLDESPVMSVAGRLKDAVEFGRWLALEIDAPADDKAMALATEAMRLLPITNNLLRSHIAHNYGIMVDRSGRPVAEASKDAFLGALLGLRTYTETEVMSAREAYYQDYNDATDEALSKAFQEQATENGRKIVKLLESSDQLTPVQISNLVYGHALAMKELDGIVEVNAYQTALMREIEKSGVLGSTKVIDNILRDLRAGRVRPTPETLEELRQINLPESQRIEEFFKLHNDMSNFTEKMYGN